MDIVGARKADIQGTSVAFPTVLSIVERLAGFNQTAMATAMSPAAATPVSARISNFRSEGVSRAKVLSSFLP
jgi:hypothetical protein